MADHRQSPRDSRASCPASLRPSPAVEPSSGPWPLAAAPAAALPALASPEAVDPIVDLHRTATALQAYAARPDVSDEAADEAGEKVCDLKAEAFELGATTIGRRLWRRSSGPARSSRATTSTSRTPIGWTGGRWP